MTKLGLLSDSHGRAETTQAAVEVLIDHGADILIHLGDVGTVQVLDALAVTDRHGGGQIESHLVFGNTDWDRLSLARYARDIGLHVHEPAGELEIDGYSVGFTHGHQPTVIQALLDRGFDYLLHGHTHLLSDSVQGMTRIINPGALFRARRYTAALLTPKDGTLEILEVASGVR